MNPKAEIEGKTGKTVRQFVLILVQGRTQIGVLPLLSQHVLSVS